MYILYHKEVYAYKDGKSAFVMTWRGKQIAMSEDKDALEEYAQSVFRKDEYYIEKQPPR